MGNTKNVISLNGKIYDVATGGLVSKSLSLSSPVKTVKNKLTLKPISGSKMIDGFVAPRKAIRTAEANHRSKTHPKRVVKHAAHRSPQRAKTLMRAMVRKPGGQSKPHIHKVSTPVKASKTTAKPQSASDRHKRADIIKRSKHVIKFAPHSLGLIKKTMPLSVKTPRKQTGEHTHKSAVKVSPTTRAAAKTAAKVTDNLFNNAVEKATSHEQPPIAKTRRPAALLSKLKPKKRSSKVILSVMATMVVVGGSLWHFWPDVKIKLASLKAGFNATLPGYTPAGFNREAVDFSKDEVSVTYKSKKDDSQYKVKQNPSDWDSATLLDNYVKSKAKQYQTVEERGKTIYTYGDSNAAWVNGGRLHKIEGNSKLKSDQILKIADSL